MISFFLVVFFMATSPGLSMDHPNMFPSSKTHIQEIIPNKKYTSQKEKDLWFIAEHVDEFNQPFWIQYAETQLEGRKNLGSSNVIASNASDGLNRFKESLRYFTNADLWVIYAYTESPTHDSPKTWFIEMAFILFVDPKSPFSSHTGISRGMEYLYRCKRFPAKCTQHPNISPPLHAFGAAFTREHYPAKDTMPEKYFMITVPIEGMHNILMKAGLPQSAIHLGDNHLKELLQNLILNYEKTGLFWATTEKALAEHKEDLLWLQSNNPDMYEQTIADSKSKYTRYKELLVTLEKYPSVIFTNHSTRALANERHWPEEFKWILFNKPGGSPLLEVTHKNVSEYRWFFSNPTTQPVGYEAFYFAVDLRELANLYKPFGIG
jgi:hypothetical protein